MGAGCFSSETVKIQVNKDKIITGVSNIPENAKIIQIDSKFKDLPEWEGERYRGEGIRRMKGYKFDKPSNVLVEMRETFWKEKIKEKFIWRDLQRAALMDDGKVLNKSSQRGKFIKAIKIKNSQWLYQSSSRCKRRPVLYS
jgi:hypothetical protein